ncbi:hypothetical protein TNIN_403041 [Trichonephila inaurata madagascariensis]|uniref:Uncharacterized protein n=1 Tax=Trichonephila inaurata madagascariensis TaxID=2747483 RepID=A0A8X6X6F9_9ARAC|nr:hypothetical protein TNIN_403041 [Trichonephila inaurata madagascariensis]
MNSRNETIFLLPKTDLGLFDLPELYLSSTGEGLENIAKTLRSKSSYTPAYDPEESTTPVRSAMTSIGLFVGTVIFIRSVYGMVSNKTG